jgi:AraC-like DNA-binding protein
MERNISKEKSRQLDEVERYVTILSMETNATTMTVAQTAIEMLDRLSAAKGTGRAQLAERLGVSRQTVTSRFRNKGMSLEDFVNTAKALDADPAKVLGQAQRINRNTNNKRNLAA